MASAPPVGLRAGFARKLSVRTPAGQPESRISPVRRSVEVVPILPPIIGRRRASRCACRAASAIGGAQRRRNREGSQKGPDPVNSRTTASVGRLRPALIAGASLFASAPLAALGRALAAWSARMDSTNSRQIRRWLPRGRSILPETFQHEASPLQLEVLEGFEPGGRVSRDEMGFGAG
jgi:hypothetical protein